MTKDIQKAVQAAEQELEEKEVGRLKEVIKNLLTRKREKEVERDELDEDIRVIKQDIDDFKAGRLDKIKERHDTNPKANESSPIVITIINDNSRASYPTQPWRWNYGLGWNGPYVYGGGVVTTTAGGTAGWVNATSLTSNTSSTVLLSGQTAATFTGGTYLVNGNSINL